MAGLVEVLCARNADGQVTHNQAIRMKANGVMTEQRLHSAIIAMLSWVGEVPNSGSI